MVAEAQVLSQNFTIIADIMETVAVLIGVCLMIGGIFQLKRYGESRTMMSGQHSIAGPLVMLVSGAMLLILPSFIGAAVLALWGTSSPLTYGGDSSGYSSLVPPILLFVRVIGVGAFIRGIVLLSRTGSQQSQAGSLGKALMHILAGVLCVHILGTIDLLEQILGLTNG